jgi:hypothetical protein
MQTFRMTRLPNSEARVDSLVDAMDRFDLKPDYQRQSGLWSEEKKQLFIDSLINGYDVPKLYFHRVSGVRAKHGHKSATPTFAIVDGKQRLETVREFLRGAFTLSEDFVDVQSGAHSDAASGKTFLELTKQYPTLASRLTQYSLDVVVIETTDEEIIEELFSRLNEAVPLNAPEKRNALGGAMPPVIRKLVRTHGFFTKCLPIENRRYKHYDLVTKFLYLADKQTFASTKKRALDDFVKSFRDTKGRPRGLPKAKSLQRLVATTMTEMVSVFEEQDELLTSVGLVTVYYMAFLRATTDKKLRAKLQRSALLQFDQVRRHNRFILRKEQQAIASGRKVRTKSHVRQDLAIFDRLMQSPNDGQALEYRYRILLSFLSGREFTEEIPSDLAKRV